MKLNFVISIIVLVIAVVIFAVIRLRNVKPNKNFIRIINIIGLCCGFLSTFFLLMSYYISPNNDISQLYKLSIPFLIILIFFMNMKRNELKK